MYVAAYVTSTLFQSLRFGWHDKNIVYTVTLFAVCVIYGDYPEIVFSSVIPYMYTYEDLLEGRVELDGGSRKRERTVDMEDMVLEVEGWLQPGGVDSMTKVCKT